MIPLVSIIIPVYNCASFLQKSLESILQQTYGNLEIIVVDDESKDDSYAIARQFESEGTKVLQQKNAGAALARNTGLSIATGDYIQFMDADDYLSPDKIAKQVEALNNYENKVAVCNYVSFTNSDELKNDIQPVDQSSFIFSSDSPPEFLVNLWGGNNGESEFIQTNCWLVPKKLIDEVGGWRPYRCPDDDGEFFARILLASKGIVYVPGIMNYYRREKSAHKLSSNPGKKYVQNTLLTIDLKYSYLKGKIEEEKIKRAFAKQYSDFAIYNYPQHPLFSKIAYKRYKETGHPASTPLLGGKVMELIKNFVGWKAARLIKFYFR